MAQDSIGTRIRKYRLAKELTQAQLAERMHLQEATLNSWESGDTAPELVQLSQLAKHLQIDEHLLSGTEAPAVVSSTRSTKRPFRFQRILSLTLSLLGLFLASFLNLRSQGTLAAFCAGAVLCLIGIGLQFSEILSIRKNTCFIKQTDFLPLQFAQLALSIHLMLFGSLLPLLLLTGSNPYLPPLQWAIYGCLFAFIIGIFCLCAIFLVNKHHGCTTFLKVESSMIIRFSVSFSVLLIAIGLMHFLAQTFLIRSDVLYPDPLLFDDWNSFRNFMQQPLASDGVGKLTLLSITPTEDNLTYTFSDPDGNTVVIPNALQHIITGDGLSIHCTYLQFNQFVSSISFSDSYTMLPVQIITKRHQQHAEGILSTVNYIFYGTYALTTLLSIFLILHKLKKSAFSKSEE